MCTAAILKFFPHSLERAGSTARIQKLVGACKLEKNLTEEQVLKHFLTSRGEAISTEGWAAVAGGKIHLANGAHLDTERPFNRHTTKGYKVNPSTSVHNFLCSCALILRVTSWRDTSKTQLTLRAGIQQLREISTSPFWGSPGPPYTANLSLALQEQKAENSENLSPCGCFIARHQKLLQSSSNRRI